jgi:hypothetical protein
MACKCGAETYAEHVVNVNTDAAPHAFQGYVWYPELGEDD